MRKGKGTFTLGGDATVAAGPIGRQASANTDVDFEAEILSYSKSRGLFAGISIDGSDLRLDEEGNKDFYGDEDKAVGILKNAESGFCDSRQVEKIQKALRQMEAL